MRIHDLLHLRWLNQNPVDGRVQMSAAHGGEKWAEVNLRYGDNTRKYLNLAFVIGVVRNYFNSFLDPESNGIVNFTVKALTSLSSFFEGKRDDEMYSKVYSRGLDAVSEGYVTKDDLINQEPAIRKIGCMDDATENERQGIIHNEKIVPKLWRLSTSFSKLKPTVSLISGFLGNGYRNLIDTLLDTPARLLWRSRFFTSSLHANFPTTILRLASAWSRSIISPAAKHELSEEINRIKDMAVDYFSQKINDKNELENKIQNKSGLRLYLEMLIDRHKEHLRGVKRPDEVLKEKVERGFLKATTEEERKIYPDRSLDKGYVTIDASTGKVSERDCTYQKRASFTDLTAPICAGLGIVGTVFFEPLKCILNIAGIERGKGFVSALASSRKSFSLFNYLTRFILQEKEEGANYARLEDLMKPKEDGSGPNKAIRELYSARKDRYKNSIFGIMVTVGSILEPLLHLRGFSSQENRFFNFLFDTFVKFNDDYFLSFFSQRRACQGRIELLHEILEKKLGKTNVTDSDFLLISDEEFDRALEARDSEIKRERNGLLDKLSGIANTGYDRVNSLFSGNLPNENKLMNFGTN